MPFRKIVDWTLLVLVLAGGVWAWRLGGERAVLEAEFARLGAKTGTFGVNNPRQIHARALRTDGPLRFGWRMFVPAGKSLRSGTDQSYTTSSFWTAGEYTVRVGFREEQGLLMMFEATGGESGSSSSMGVCGDRSLADFLRGRWDRVVVEQFGRDAVAVADPGKPLTLLRLSLPPDLIAEARAKLSPQSQGFIPEIFTVTIP